MPESVLISFRTSRDKVVELDRLAEVMELPRTELLRRALDAYLDETVPMVTKLQEAIASLDRGEYVAHEDIVAWVNSWGTDNEVPPPPIRRDKRGKS